MTLDYYPGHQCWRCKQPFTEANVKSEAGWRELFISGTCEICFDELMPEEE